MTTLSRVLVVDDEKPLRDFIRRNLEVRGFQVLTASNGLEALSIFNQQNVDLVIMDLMMPNMDGLETIRRIRQSSLVPIIVLSALGEEPDKVKALNRGADDFLSKPFGLPELLARVRAVLRRASWQDSPTPKGRLIRGDFTADLDRHQITVRGKPIELTPTEYRLLIQFMENSGKVLHHQEILQRVWGPEYGRETEYLRVYLGRLRQKIEIDPGNPVHLVTEHGIGYLFLG